MGICSSKRQLRKWCVETGTMVFDIKKYIRRSNSDFQVRSSYFNFHVIEIIICLARENLADSDPVIKPQTDDVLP